MSECSIDGVVYPLASEKNNVLFNIADTGEALIETWNDWHLGLGATLHIPGMYWFSTGGDASRYGQIRAPLGYTASALTRTSAQHAQYFQADSGTGVRYTYRINNRGDGSAADFQKFSGDMSTLINSLGLGGATVGPGRPVFWGGKWYFVIGGTAIGTGDVYRLETVSDIGTIAGDVVVQAWKAICLSTFTSGGTAKIARAYDTNKVALATAAPLLTTDPGSWASGVAVGDQSTAITDMVENQGLLFVAKEDNLYEFDSDSVARPVLPFGDRVGVDRDNGKGMLAFGDTILYPSVGGLWRYKIGQSARPVSIDTIGTYSDTGLGGVFRFRHRGLTNIGEWIWMVYEDGSANTYPLAARLRRPDDPPGHEFVWHIPAVVTGSRSKGIFATSSQRLVFQNASDSASAADQMLPLGADGSPASFTGTRTTGGQFPFGSTDFGRPHKRKQVRSVYLDFDNFGGVQVRASLDDAATVNVGSPLTVSGVANHTPGTSDKCNRYRVNLQFTDATAILRSVTVEARTPSVYKVVIPADDESLDRFGMTAEDVRINLMRLVNKGLVSVIGPAGVRDMTPIAGTPTAWQGYVEKMTDTVYESDQGTGHGIEVLISRYTTDGN